MSELFWSEVLGSLSRHSDITQAQARQAMTAVMAGEATAAQIAGFIVSLRMKGETVEEMTGLVEGMRAAAVHADLGTDEAVDIVGTGGDGSGTSTSRPRRHSSRRVPASESPNMAIARCPPSVDRRMSSRPWAW